MDLLTNRVERTDLQPGDHIYTYKALYAYSQHGIFIGEGKVIGLVSRKTKSSSLSCCAYLCDSGIGKSNVISMRLDKFLGARSLYRYKYGVSGPFFLSRIRGGTCTTAVSDASNTVVNRAKYLLRHGFGQFDSVKNNCEDFALYCKTGLVLLDNSAAGRSGQIASFGLPFLPLFFSPRGFECLNKDIGKRTDVIKVEVEDLHKKMGWEKCLEEKTGGNDDAANRKNPIG